MNTNSKIALGVLAGLGIAASTAVLAQGHGPMMGHGSMMGHGPMAKCMDGGPEAHLGTLKTELKLTAKQQPAWDAFEQAVHAQHQAMTETRSQQHAGKHDPDTHIAFMEQRLAGMKTVAKARTDLFQVLTPEQQSVFDKHGPRG
jgi:Spy/CpxP family protein refolding chaperone